MEYNLSLLLSLFVSFSLSWSLILFCFIPKPTRFNKERKLPLKIDFSNQLLILFLDRMKFILWIYENGRFQLFTPCIVGLWLLITTRKKRYSTRILFVYLLFSFALAENIIIPLYFNCYINSHISQCQVTLDHYCLVCNWHQMVSNFSRCHSISMLNFQTDISII